MAAEITSFEVKNLESFFVVGKMLTCQFGHPEGNPIPALWCQCFEDGTLSKIEAIEKRIHTNALVGWMGNVNMEEKTFQYIVGVLTSTDAVIPDNLTKIEMSASRFAVSTIYGTEPDIYMCARDLTDNEIKQHHLQYDEKLACEMEWYDERFDGNAEHKTISFYIPVL